MLLDRIDIESHGPIQEIHLGPFSPALNILSAPSGTGKTALVRFLRDSLAGASPAFNGMAQSAGRVVWAAADGLFHCHRQPDGTRHGRRHVDFERRLEAGENARRWARESIVVDLPAAIVDGIVTDTTITSVERVIAAAVDAGLDRLTTDHDREQPAEIAAYLSDGSTEEQLRNRRAELALELSAIDARKVRAEQAKSAAKQRRREREAMDAIHEDLHRLRRQEVELRTKIGELDAALRRCIDQDDRTEHRWAIGRAQQERLQRVDEQIDRLRRLHREIRTLRTAWFGQPSSGDAGDAALFDPPLRTLGPYESKFPHRDSDLPLERPFDAGLIDPPTVEAKLESVCRLVETLLGRCEASLASIHTIENRASVANVNGRSESDQTGSIGDVAPLDGGSPDRARLRHREFDREHRERLLAAEAALFGLSEDHYEALAATLQGIAQRLHSLRLRHHDRTRTSHWAIEPDDGLAWTPQSPGLATPAQCEALSRCEQELVDTLRRWVVRREVLLRRIAETQNIPFSQLTSAMGEWSDKHEKVVYDWLISEATPPHSNDVGNRESQQQRLREERGELVTDLERTLSRISDRTREIDSLKQQLRYLPVIHRVEHDALWRVQVEAEYRRLGEQLATTQIDAALLRRREATLRRSQTCDSAQVRSGAQRSALAMAASVYLRQLTGGQFNDLSWESRFADRHAYDRATDQPSSPRARAVTIDGLPEHGHSVAVRCLAALAVRMAAADELTRRGRPLPLIFETPSLSTSRDTATHPGLHPFAPTLIAVLAESVRRGRQILVLTDDLQFCDLAKRRGGAIHSLAKPAVWRQSQPALASVLDINRDLDVAWRESSTGEESGWPELDRQASKTTTPYFDRQDVGVHRSSQSLGTNQSAGRAEAAVRPFFLAGDSPVEHGPSIDAIAAAHLRAIGIVTIEQLIDESPKGLAQRLGVGDIDAATLRRWQHECRLMCGVRRLRGFDAKVLVGCGITHPRELEAIDSKTLAKRVESFLASDRGGKILRTGTSREIARLTRWIADARGDDASSAVVAASVWGRQDRALPRKVDPTAAANAKLDRSHKYHLHHDSPVAEAPSIGPRMAERLGAIGVITVADLLSRSPKAIAADLKLRRIDAGTVRKWQQQAKLVCQIPHLRGHDAQLLVAAGIHEANRVAQCDPQWLLDQILPISHSREGKAILRGGSEPDLAEIRQWIAQARNHRELLAA